MIRILIAVTFALAVAIVVAAGVYTWGKAQFEGAGPLAEPTAVVIAPGSGLNAIADELHSEGVIEHREVFVWGARLTGKARRLQAGEYTFPARVSPRRALDIIVSGETVVRRLTVPEGSTIAEAVAIVQNADGLTGDIGEVPPEGTLLPETYHYSFGDDRAEMLRRMERKMDALLAELWPERSEGLPLASKREAVILASIVEKETSVADERPLIAGVFVNRLNKGMRLQSDPTVRYAVSEETLSLARRLTREDLQLDHPYNTYLNAGLPPGPIANPGRASIEAVLNPAETDYLYFVADGSGGHNFARTLQDHNRNVARWRQIRDGGDN